MKNELLTIGPFTVYGYGLMIAIGIFAAYIVTEYRARKQGLPYEHVFYIVIWCVLGGFLSAKLLFWITEWKDVLEDPLYYLKNMMDGFVVYGGIIGGILAGYIYARVKKLNFLAFFDLVMPSVALAQGFGRIGCFLAGCCYGRETSAWYGVTFEHSPFAPNHVSLIPTQLISSAADFLHFFLLLWITKKRKTEGIVVSFYLIFYSIGRFLIEMLRNDPRGSVSFLSTSQFISIFTLIIGILSIVLLKRKGVKEERVGETEEIR